MLASLVVTDQTFDEAPEEIDCPYELAYIWGYFRDLDARRPNGGMGFSPITHEAITAWSDGLEIGIKPFERQCIVAIDDAYRDHINSKDKD